MAAHPRVRGRHGLVLIALGVFVTPGCEPMSWDRSTRARSQAQFVSRRRWRTLCRTVVVEADDAPRVEWLPASRSFASPLASTVPARALDARSRVLQRFRRPAFVCWPCRANRSFMVAARADDAAGTHAMVVAPDRCGCLGAPKNAQDRRWRARPCVRRADASRGRRHLGVRTGSAPVRACAGPTRALAGPLNTMLSDADQSMRTEHDFLDRASPCFDAAPVPEGRTRPCSRPRRLRTRDHPPSLIAGGRDG
jgi:hypothetical protein